MEGPNVWSKIAQELPANLKCHITVRRRQHIWMSLCSSLSFLFSQEYIEGNTLCMETDDFFFLYFFNVVDEK